MYEIRDLDVPEHLCATVATVVEAQAYLEYREATTCTQLAANGEGASRGIRVASAVYDQHGARLMAGIVRVRLQ